MNKTTTDTQETKIPFTDLIKYKQKVSHFRISSATSAVTTPTYFASNDSKEHKEIFIKPFDENNFDDFNKLSNQQIAKIVHKFYKGLFEYFNQLSEEIKKGEKLNVCQDILETIKPFILKNVFFYIYP